MAETKKFQFLIVSRINSAEETSKHCILISKDILFKLKSHNLFLLKSLRNLALSKFFCSYFHYSWCFVGNETFSSLGNNDLTYIILRCNCLLQMIPWDSPFDCWVYKPEGICHQNRLHGKNKVLNSPSGTNLYWNNLICKLHPTSYLSYLHLFHITLTIYFELLFLGKVYLKETEPILRPKLYILSHNIMFSL